jgi:hypothetical protein
MAKAEKKYTHMVCSVYASDPTSNESAYLFTSLDAATTYVHDELKSDKENCDTDDETYYIAEIVSSSKIARSIVTVNHKK